MGATLDGKVDYQVQRTIADLQRQIAALTAQITALQNQLAQAQAAIPTMAQIQAALSSTGTNPLNLSGLSGTLATH